MSHGFNYINNSGLCGASVNISPCLASGPTSSKPPPPEPSQKFKRILSLTTAIVFAVGGSAFLILVYICLKHWNANLRYTLDIKPATNTDVKLVQTSANSGEKAENISETTHHLRGSFNGSTPDFSTLGRSRVMSGRSTSTVASNGLSSPAEWNSWIHLDELETATNYFSEKNLLRKSCHSAVYQGVLRDGTVVAVKAIYNTRYSFGEQDFQNALEALLQVKHENLVNFLGFCCSKGGSECFLVYELVSCGSLEKNLHGPSEVLLNWSMRVNIIRGIAKGLNRFFSHT